MNDNNFENSGFNTNPENSTFEYDINQPPQKKPQKGKVTTIIITVAIIAVASIVGKFAGSFIANIFKSNDINAEIEEYIEKMEDYTPGSFTDKEYTSEHFGLKFKANNEWIMFTKDELEPLSKQIKESSISSGVKSLKEESVDQDLIDKWSDALYAETEMGASYIDNNMVAGQVFVQVFGAYGIEELDEDKYIEELKTQLSTQVSDISIGEKTIAGKTYKSLKAKQTASGITAVIQMFVRIEDGMFCMIVCDALEGYENEVTNSFLAQMSEYK